MFPDVNNWNNSRTVLLIAGPKFVGWDELSRINHVQENLQPQGEPDQVWLGYSGDGTDLSVRLVESVELAVLNQLSTRWTRQENRR